YPSGEKKFADFLAEVKAKTLKAFENQEYQYEDLVEKVAVTRDVSRNPLFDTMFVLQNIDAAEINMPGLKLLPYEYENKTSKFDLTITALERGEELGISFRYRTALFKNETMERFSMCFKQMTANILQNPGIKIEEIDIITETEKKRVLFDFNDTEAVYPTGKTIRRLFAEQVEKTPDNIAVVSEEQRIIQITYRELNNRSNRLANRLKAKETRHSAIVGIMVRPSPAMVVGIIGILKAGCAFLPIEPESPGDRINYILNDSNMNILLTQGHLQETFHAGIEIINIDDAALYKGQCENPVNVITPADPVYVIYTSGTTGKPKGALINNRNLVNYVGWFVQTNRQDAINKAILTSSFAFDALYTQFFSSLLSGYQLHVIPRETFLFAERLLTYLKTHRITYIKATPSLFNLIINDPGFTAGVLQELRFVILGGEEINANDVEKAHHLCPHLQIMNHYGPTETTIGSIARFLDFDKFAAYKINPTIGKPIHNTGIYILDKGYNMVPIGVVGEMFIGGDGVGMGYLNKPELTAEKFRPLLKNINRALQPNIHHSNFYCTGDLARWHPDGYIEFLGRADDQVKIRGYRVEPGEIENHLLKYNDIKEAVVLAREKKKKEKYLCAYFVSAKQIKISDLREFLSRRLPPPMIPAYFIQLEKMPLTKHNKLNRWALPEPEFDKNLPTGLPPRNEIEMKLAEIWATILEIEPATISRDDNFFNLGGHSLKATILVSKIYKEFNVKLPLIKIFQQSTIRDLAAVIAQSHQTLFLDIPIVETGEYYPLSYHQQRLYILCQLQPGSPAFHMPGAVDLEHEVDPTVVAKVLERLIRAHESFRTSIAMIEGQAVQVVHKEVSLPCEILDLSMLNAEEKAEKLNEVHLRIAGLPFDLSRPPLLRSGLVKLAPFHYRLMFNMHHIISDGWSMELLKKDFLRLYE
ncbi:MAG TPA: amino acid adenylation domain-containing protein, partial [Candidatus Deferrimicrobium sp.]|nr:amino acid adenylation domain-containing protein [Candidatus Deferrimicrobium sp.]